MLPCYGGIKWQENAFKIENVEKKFIFMICCELCHISASFQFLFFPDRRTSKILGSEM